MIFSFDGGVYNFSERRLKDLFLNYAAEGEPNYAKAYVTWISPLDYLSLTVPGDVQEFIEKANPLDYKELCRQRQEMFLTVDFKDGRVVGHEGRHRMAALHKAGAKLVAITVIPRDQSDKYNRQWIESMTVKGQTFPIDYPHTAPGVVELKGGLTPVSMANKDFLYNTYGPIVPLETFKGKKIYGVEDIFQFSFGEKVWERKTYVGTVSGFSDNENYKKIYDAMFPWVPSYVWLHNEKNPKGYQDYAIKTNDFLTWIQEGKYKVPAKDMPKALDDVISAASRVEKEAVGGKVERNPERE